MGPRWQKVRSDLLHRRSRSVLAILSLIVGIFAVGTIYLATTDIQRSFANNFDEANPPSAVLSIDMFEADLITDVRNLESVGEAEARKRLAVRVRPAGEEWMNFQVVAMPDFNENTVSRIQPEEGVWPPVDGSIVIERASVQELGVDIGDVVTVQAAGEEPLDLEVRGVAHDFWEVAPTFGGTPRGYVTLSTAEELSGSDLMNAIYLRAAENPLDREEAIAVSASVRDGVIEPAGHVVERSEIREPSEHQTQNAVDGLVIAVSLLSVFILVLACVLVVNTMSALLVEQRRQLGVMKAVGATSGQLTRLYLAYSLALGIVALVVAVPLSILAGRAMAGFFAKVLNVQLLSLQIPWSTLAIEFAVATIAPTLAVIWSVRRAARQSVRETISDYGLSSGSGAALSPGLRFASSPTRLAVRNTFRNRSRLVLTLATIGLTGAILVGLLSTDRALGQVAEEVAGYTDYDIELRLTQTVPFEAAESVVMDHSNVASVEGWLARDAFRIRPDDTENENVSLISLPPESELINPTVTSGRWLEPADEFTVVVNDDFLREESDLEVGDDVLLDIEGQRRTWQIVGSVTTQLIGPIVYVPVESLSNLLQIGGETNFLALNLQPGTDQETASDQLEQSLIEEGVPVGAVQTNTEIRGTTQSLFDLLVGALLVVTALLGVVAVVGLTGTMTLGVMERTREIGVMRAVGASSWGIQRGLLIEGITLGFTGWLLGSLLGLPVAWILGQLIGEAFLFTPLPFAYSWLAVGIWLIATLLIGVIGATRPARVASRLTIRETLAYE